MMLHQEVCFAVSKKITCQLSFLLLFRRNWNHLPFFSALISTSPICLSFCRLRFCHGGIAAWPHDVPQVTSLNLFIPLTFDYATGKARQMRQEDVDGCM